MPLEMANEKNNKGVSIKKEDKVYSQWTAFNNTHHSLKMICMGLVILCLSLEILCFIVGDKTPIVIKESLSGNQYFTGEKKVVPLKEENIKKLIRQFLELRYEWDEFKIKQIELDISPFITQGLKKKTKKLLENLSKNDFKEKKLSQKITKPQITVTDKSTSASFYRVLEINEIPLLIPTQISFGLVKGETSFWNRIGIYINSINIFEGS